MKVINRIIISFIVSILLCISAYAEEPLSINDAMDIILDYHNIETSMDVSDYLTLDALTITREAAITAVIRSYGVYPSDEPDYIWADEVEQSEIYKPYIDYAKRMGIVVGTGDNFFTPKQIVTKNELLIMLTRADGINPQYKISYDYPICKLLSADIQKGLSEVPIFLLESFYSEGRTITATTNPIIRNNRITVPSKYTGWIQYEGDMWLSVDFHNHPTYDQEWVTIHEIGHYLGHRTKLLNRYSIPGELNWLKEFSGNYCSESNHEFFAESFATYILFQEELGLNAPTIYNHINNCLNIMSQ